MINLQIDSRAIPVIELLKLKRVKSATVDKAGVVLPIHLRYWADRGYTVKSKGTIRVVFAIKGNSTVYTYPLSISKSKGGVS